MNTRLTCLLSVVLGFSLTPTLLSAAEKFSYKDNVFDLDQGCVGIRKGQSLALNEEVLVFFEGNFNVAGKVVGFVPMEKAKKIFTDPSVYGRELLDIVKRDDPLWEELGCFGVVNGHMYTTIAKIKTVRGHPGGAVVRGLPANTWFLPNLEGPVRMAVKNNPYVELVRHLTGACYVPDSRIEVSKTKAHAIP